MWQATGMIGDHMPAASFAPEGLHKRKQAQPSNVSTGTNASSLLRMR
jgi:hypothetical protein